MQTLSKLSLPMLYQGGIEERTQWNKLKVFHLFGFEPRTSACCEESTMDIYTNISKKDKISVKTVYTENESSSLS